MGPKNNKNRFIVNSSCFFAVVLAAAEVLNRVVSIRESEIVINGYWRLLDVSERFWKFLNVSDLFPPLLYPHLQPDEGRVPPGNLKLPAP